MLPIPSTYGESSKQIRRRPTAAVLCLPRGMATYAVPGPVVPHGVSDRSQSPRRGILWIPTQMSHGSGTNPVKDGRARAR
ncbi:hypothetical protein D9M72_348150 [compost metagenome]